MSEELLNSAKGLSCKVEKVTFVEGGVEVNSITCPNGLMIMWENDIWGGAVQADDVEISMSLPFKAWKKIGKELTPEGTDFFKEAFAGFGCTLMSRPYVVSEREGKPFSLVFLACGDGDKYRLTRMFKWAYDTAQLGQAIISGRIPADRDWMREWT